MNAMSLDHLWRYIQGLSLSASNQRWLGERLIEASKSQTIQDEDEKKIKKLNSLFGVWSERSDGERIENIIRENRETNYERRLFSFDE